MEGPGLRTAVRALCGSPLRRLTRRGERGHGPARRRPALVLSQLQLLSSSSDQMPPIRIPPPRPAPPRPSPSRSLCSNWMGVARSSLAEPGRAGAGPGPGPGVESTTSRVKGSWRRADAARLGSARHNSSSHFARRGGAKRREKEL